MGPTPDWDILKRQRKEDKFEVSLSYPLSIVAEEISPSVRSTSALAEDSSAVPSTHMIAHNHLEFQFQRI